VKSVDGKIWAVMGGIVTLSPLFLHSFNGGTWGECRSERRFTKEILMQEYYLLYYGDGTKKSMQEDIPVELYLVLLDMQDMLEIQESYLMSTRIVPCAKLIYCVKIGMLPEKIMNEIAESHLINFSNTLATHSEFYRCGSHYEMIPRQYIHDQFQIRCAKAMSHFDNVAASGKPSKVIKFMQSIVATAQRWRELSSDGVAKLATKKSAPTPPAPFISHTYAISPAQTATSPASSDEMANANKETTEHTVNANNGLKEQFQMPIAVYLTDQPMPFTQDSLPDFTKGFWESTAKYAERKGISVSSLHKYRETKSGAVRMKAKDGKEYIRDNQGNILRKVSDKQNSPCEYFVPYD